MHNIESNDDLSRVVDSFFDNGSKTQSPPRAVIVMGGVGSGKTTLRRNKLAENYVQIDGSDIFAQIVDEDTADDLDLYLPIIDKIGQEITSRAVREKCDLAIEHTGDNADEMKSIIDKLESIGYIVDISMVNCDPAEAYQRHLAATHVDYHYLSCYFTKDLHTKWILGL